MSMNDYVRYRVFEDATPRSANAYDTLAAQVQELQQVQEAAFRFAGLESAIDQARAALGRKE